MSRPTRASAAGRAYLDLQNRARADSRPTQDLLTLYAVERWLARLSVSPHAASFVLKGGMLLAAFGARRPTVDADALVRDLPNDRDSVLALVTQIADQPMNADDGITFLTGTATARTIRDDELYSGVRVAMDCALASARVKLRLDVNFGDPVTPEPQMMHLPALRPGDPAIRVLGYPIVTVLAEKIATAIALGPTNTRVRDYADVYMLTGLHSVAHAEARRALVATAAHRQVELVPLSTAMVNLVELRGRAYTAYRAGLGPDGLALPDDFGIVARAVADFADCLVTDKPDLQWNYGTRMWE